MLTRRAPLKRRRDVEPRIQKGPQLVWPRHRRLVKAHVCAGWAKDSEHCEGPIEFCHCRLHTNTGMGQTPPDWFGFPACGFHHRFSQHQHGEAQFQRDHGIILLRIALEFAAISAGRDPEFRAAFEDHKRREPHLFEIAA